ncbi:MAG: hypothetical protein HYX20_02385 [Candidatus Yanofskybacteria bacterium]|nr:hypothetical protein [Candidatus Yanofskybacteria bacterium]
MKKHILNLFLLFLAFLSGILGILLLKSIYNDFSLVDISFLMIAVTLLGSALFVSFGTYIGFYAFKRMKGR